MRKILTVALVLVLASLACGLSKVTPEPPTAVPVAPTQAPERPTLPPLLPTLTQPSPPQLPTQAPQIPTAQPNLNPPPDNQVYGEPVYQTQFDGNDMGWDEWEAEESSVAFRDGKIFLEVKKTQWEIWTNPDDLVITEPVVIETLVQRVAGPEDGDYGFVCNYLDTENYYSLLVHDDGRASIYRRLGGESTELAWAESSAIVPGEMNVLRASCLDGVQRLEVNGVGVVEAADSSLGPGNVGLMAGAYDQAGLVAAFDSFTVYPENAFISWDSFPVPGETLYTTGFEANTADWGLGVEDLGIAEIVNDRLEIGVPEANWFSWSIAYDLYFNEPVIIEVSARVLSGPEDANYGVVCGMQESGNYYFIITSDDGFTAIGKSVDNVASYIDSAWISPPQPGSVQWLRVSCLEDSISLDLNGTHVLSAPAQAGTGSIGLLGGTNETPNARIAFDDLVVSKALDSGEPIGDVTQGGSELFFDAFTAESDDWNWLKDQDFDVSWVNNEMQVDIHTAWLDINIPLYREVSGPVRVELDGRWVKGDKMVAYGIMCGRTNELYYGLNITETGYAEVFRWKNDVRTPIWERKSLSEIQSGGNLLAAECSGNDLRFYVNGSLVAELREYFPIDGTVGVIVGSYGSGNVSVAIDNFRVIQLSE